MDSTADIGTLLGALAEGDLVCLRSMLDRLPSVAPGLVAWLEHAINWDTHRREVFFYRLLGPVPPSTTLSLATALLRSQCLQLGFDGRTNQTPAANFFEVAVLVLRAEREQPEVLQ